MEDTEDEGVGYEVCLVLTLNGCEEVQSLMVPNQLKHTYPLPDDAQLALLGIYPLTLKLLTKLTIFRDYTEKLQALFD